MNTSDSMLHCRNDGYITLSPEYEEFFPEIFKEKQEKTKAKELTVYGQALLRYYYYLYAKNSPFINMLFSDRESYVILKKIVGYHNITVEEFMEYKNSNAELFDRMFKFYVPSDEQIIIKVKMQLENVTNIFATMQFTEKNLEKFPKIGKAIGETLDYIQKLEANNKKGKGKNRGDKQVSPLENGTV